MDPETIKRLVAEHPEQYRGGRIDRDRPLGQMVSEQAAREKADRCLADGYEEGAAYWAGFAAAVKGGVR